jgi:hypothetical protein
VNERIQKLADEAREYATTRHPVSNITLSVNLDLFEQKFAELIINECADVATINQFQHDPVGRFVREHFEVTGF